MTEESTTDPDVPAAADPWHLLVRFTAARIALGRAGGSVPTRPLLAFQLDHARARDAVLHDLDVTVVERELDALKLPVLRLASAAADRATYIARPDLGRVLDQQSVELLSRRAEPDTHCDAAFVLADGLSARAVERHAARLLAALLPLLARETWTIAPACIVRQGRVAVSDPIGELLGAQLAVILIGERPGLSSPDSLGVYLTWNPRSGRNSAGRNCISNIREPGGLAYAEAARKLHYLMSEARRQRLSGVALKENTPDLPLQSPALPAD